MDRHKTTSPKQSRKCRKSGKKRSEKASSSKYNGYNAVLAKMEAQEDHRGSFVALREIRECMESIGEMSAKAEALKAGGVLEVKNHFGA